MIGRDKKLLSQICKKSSEKEKAYQLLHPSDDEAISA